MGHIIEVLVGVSVILIAMGIATILKIIWTLVSDVRLIKYELSINGGTDSVKDRLAIVQGQVSDLQQTLENHLEGGDR